MMLMSEQEIDFFFFSHVNIERLRFAGKCFIEHFLVNLHPENLSERLEKTKLKLRLFRLSA